MKKTTTRPTKKRKYMKSLAARVKALEMAPEVKTHDETYTNYDNESGIFDGAGDTQILNNIPDIVAGNTNASKIGNQVTNLSLMLRLELAYSFYSEAIHCCRYAIVWDKQPESVVASYQQIFKTNASTLSAVNKSVAPVNRANRDRFVVLYDSVNGNKAEVDFVTFQGPDTTGNIKLTRHLSDTIYLDLKKIKATYGVTVAAASECTTNQLLFVSVNNVFAPFVDPLLTGPAALPMQAHMYSRIRFTDE